jgi:hypothetical protein
MGHPRLWVTRLIRGVIAPQSLEPTPIRSASQDLPITCGPPNADRLNGLPSWEHFIREF